MLKVYGGNTFLVDVGQVPSIVAANTQKQAAEFFGISFYTFKNWFSQTGNKTQIEYAMSKPGKVFIKLRGRNEWIERDNFKNKKD